LRTEDERAGNNVLAAIRARKEIGIEGSGGTTDRVSLKKGLPSGKKRKTSASSFEEVTLGSESHASVGDAGL